MKFKKGALLIPRDAQYPDGALVVVRVVPNAPDGTPHPSLSPNEAERV